MSVAPTLVERLGHPAGTSVLVLTCDGLGASHASSTAVLAAVAGGLATSAGLQVPGAWARWAAGRLGTEDVGVHLTLNAPHPSLRCGPLTHAPTLVDGAGAFPATATDLGEHADGDELRREVRAQVERALEWGIDVTHLSVHLDALWLRPELFDVVLDAAVAQGLPLRPPPAEVELGLGYPSRALAAEAGVVLPDRVLRAGPGRSGRSVLDAELEHPVPGVTEIVLAPAVDTPEHRALVDQLAAGVPPVGGSEPDAVDDLALLTSEPGLAARIAEAGIVMAGWRTLRDLQRRPADQPAR